MIRPCGLLGARLERGVRMVMGAAACSVMLGTAGPVAAAGAAVDAEHACTALQGLKIPAARLGLPTSGAKVRSANLIAADGADNKLGEYCLVKGVIAPVDPSAPGLEFEVNLPSKWNFKALQMGGGGYDGTLVTGLGPEGLQLSSAEMPLKQGYVTLGSDGGHKGGPGFDGTFALNDEALLNYGKQSVKKTHDAAIAVISARYQRIPKRFYFIGNSQGGHEALDAAARYPADYDGVVANYPAYNVMMLHLGSLNAGKAVYANGGAGWMNARKVKLLTDAVVAACDQLDGAQDGIVSNVAGCNAHFNIESVRSQLRCKEGADTGDTCLSDAQIEAVLKIATPYRPGFTIAGSEEFPRWAILEGSRFLVANLGKSPIPGNPPQQGDAILYMAGSGTSRFAVTRDPTLDALTFDPAAWKTRIQQLGAILDVTDVDLTPFRSKGGKIIMVHGTEDEFITPHNSDAYYARHLALQGAKNMDAFFRYYKVPGLSHGFGTFNAKYPGLAVLDAWVEQGHAPGQLLATDENPGAGGRTRPMCRYPMWPKFTAAATASLNEAANYSCVER